MTYRLDLRRPAFSMISLLVILAIIAILLALLLPAIQKVRESAARAQSMNNLKQIALALHSYHDVARQLPPAYDRAKAVTGSVFVHILPYIEQAALYQTFQENSFDASRVRIVTYMSPLDPSLGDQVEGPQNFPANLRVFATSGLKTPYDQDIRELKAVEPGKMRLAETLDGTSNTIWLATKWANCGDGGSRFNSPPNTKTAPFFGQNHATQKAAPTGDHVTF